MPGEMFDVTVISDPGFALAPQDPMWNADLAAFARYDTALLKPVLLFADSVSLRTFRADMLGMVDADEFRLTIMPMRRLMRFIHLSSMRDMGELDYIGISESTLAPKPEASRVLRAITRRAGKDQSIFSYINKFEEKYEDSIEEVAVATGQRLIQRRDLLTTNDLNPAIQAGILTVSGWGTDGPERYTDEWYSQRWMQAWASQEEFFAHGYLRILRSLTNSSCATMFEPGTQMFLSMINNGVSVQAKRKSRANRPPLVPTTADMAASVIGRLPGLSDFSIAELLEMRDDLAEYLPAFRAAMIDLADEVRDSEPNPSPEVASRRLDRAWHQKVSPALKDMEVYARHNGYPRQLLNVFSEDKGALAGAISSIGLAAGSLVAGAAAFVPAAVAASIPFIKALNSTLRERDKLERNRLYFLYKLQSQLKKS